MVENLPGAVGSRIERRNRPTKVRRRPRPTFEALDSGARRRRPTAGGVLAIPPVENRRKITCPGT
jgi:hypothetical protein